MVKKFLWLFLLTPSLAAHAQEMMLQGWYWNYPFTSQGAYWVDTLALQSKQLSDAGFNYIWLPPLSRASGGNLSNGYDIFDYYNLGTDSKPNSFGNLSRINQLIDSFGKYHITAIADMIYNHRVGGKWENNSAVEGWIENYNLTKHNNGDVCYPSDRFRCIVPVGGSTGHGAGTYYFKVHSASGSSDYYNHPYTFRISDNRKYLAGGTDLTELEPNGGADCGEGDNVIYLGRNMKATIDNGGCGTDEFAFTLDTSQFYSQGDTLFISLTNDLGSYSDHFIYGLWYSGTNSDIQGSIAYQTATDFFNVSSGRGQMNYPAFKPNGNPTCLCGDEDAMLFYYDIDQNVPSVADTFNTWTEWMMQNIGVNGLRIDAVKNFTPVFTGHLLDYLHQQGCNPKLVVGESYDYDAGVLTQRLNDVYNNMQQSTKDSIYYSLFDFNLQACLRDACDAYGNDVRNVFNCGMHGANQVFRKNIVTFVNNHDLRDSSQSTDWDPILAYAYIITNPLVGIPCVYWSDYHNATHPTYYHDLNQLIRAYRNFIQGAQNVEYLSRFNTPYTLNFSSGTAGTSLIYELSGMSNTCFSDRDVLVAINFSGAPMQVTVSLNTGIPYHLQPGDTLCDILGRSNASYTVIDGNSSVYLDVPARSYSVWARVAPVHAVNIEASGVTSFCRGDSVTLSFNDSTSCYTYQWMKDGILIDGATSQALTVRQSGDFQLKYGYTLSNTSNIIGVTVNPEHPLVSVNGNELSCSVSGVAYQWYEGADTSNLTSIPGATSQTYAPSHGDYFSVAITDANGCADRSDTLLFFPVGIHGVSTGTGVEIFPNPAGAVLNITLNSRYSLIQVQDVTGRVVLERNASGEKPVQLNIGTLPAAIYVVKCYSDQGVYTEPFVKE